MIRKTFSFLPGIEAKTQASLNAQGISDWHDFLSSSSVTGMSSKRKSYYDRQLTEAGKQLKYGNASYFASSLAKDDHWRLYDHFKEEACFLDIETTGLSHQASVTVVGLFDGFTTKSMIKGINLDIEGLKEELSKYKMLVTFNGSVFDVPFLERRFPGLVPNIPHMDLRFVCKKVGLVGGLKNIEAELGIGRRDLVEGMSGGDALTLWRMYKSTGDDHYLNLLVEYNEEDVINLKRIADTVYCQLSTGK
ncbi:MAG: ribonuclease H-like domain-containing protein [Nanoarchaeota archaeon]|nr:ribonuclease H-like domain-containing protein [Nanoarchaeota archaeon]